MRKKGDFTVAFRLPLLEYAELEKIAGPDKPFENTSDACRILIAYGLRFFKLKKMADDPDFVRDIEQRFGIKMARPTFEQIINNADLTEIDAMMLKLETVKNKKIERMIIDSQ